MLIQRRLLRPVLEALVEAPLVIVEGSPGCGKTSFAAQVGVASLGGGLVLDGGLPAIKPSLLDPRMLARRGRLLVVDRADADPALLPALASWARAEAGRGGRVLLIGQAFLKALPEELVGDRARAPSPRFELPPLGYEEVGTELKERLWLRGGLPQSLLAGTELEAFVWLGRHLDSLVQGRLVAAGIHGPATRTRALLEALAQGQGRTFPESVAARSLGVSRPTVVRALAVLERIGLLRFLPSLASPSGKRAILSPAVYLRDPGILHALLGLGGARVLEASPHREASWRGFVVEECLKALPRGLEASRYLTRDGAGLDLVIRMEDRTALAIVARAELPGPRGLRGGAIAAMELGAQRQILALPSHATRAGPGPLGWEAMDLGKLIGIIREMTPSAL